MHALIDFNDVVKNAHIKSQNLTNNKSCHNSKKENPSIQVDTITPDYNLEMLKSLHPGKLLFSIEETASILNVSYEFIRQRLLTGKIPPVSFGGRKMINIIILAQLISMGVN